MVSQVSQHPNLLHINQRILAGNCQLPRIPVNLTKAEHIKLSFVIFRVTKLNIFSEKTQVKAKGNGTYLTQRLDQKVPIYISQMTH